MSSVLTFKKENIYTSKFKAYKRAREPTLLKLLLQGLINFDGTVDTKELNNGFTKDDLWFYTWYLWKYNHETIPEFRNMSSLKNKDAPSSDNFILAVKGRQDTTLNEYLIQVTGEVTKEDIANFINDQFRKYKEKIQIPDLSTLFKKLEARLLQKEKRLVDGIKNVNAKVNAAITQIAQPRDIVVKVLTGNVGKNAQTRV